MSAKVVVCLIVAAYLLWANHAIAFYSDEYFVVVNVEEVVNDDGKVTFTGEVLNISEFQAVTPIQTFITIKRGGVVSGVISSNPDSYDPVQPGQTTTFTVESDFEQGQYDEFIIRSRLKTPFFYLIRLSIKWIMAI